MGHVAMIGLTWRAVKFFDRKWMEVPIAFIRHPQVPFVTLLQTEVAILTRQSTCTQKVFAHKFLGGQRGLFALSRPLAPPFVGNLAYLLLLH